MFTISRAQYEALTAAIDEHFVAGMVEHFRKTMRQWTDVQGEAGVRSFIKDGIRKAAGHGVKIEFDVARYLIVMQVLGANFDRMPEHAWAAKVLDNNEMSASEKMTTLLETIIDRSAGQ